MPKGHIMLLHTKRPRNSSVQILSAFLFAAWEAMAAQTLAALLELAPESVRNDFEPLGPCALRDLAAAQAGAMLGGMTSDLGKATDIVTARFFSCKLLGTYTTPAERGQTEIHNIGASSTRTTMTAELRQRAWKAQMTTELRLRVPMRTLLRCLRKRMRWRMHCVCMRQTKPRKSDVIFTREEKMTHRPIFDFSG